MDAGLIPVSTNPITLSILKLREMQKMYHGTRMVDQIKSSGIARWVPSWRYGEAAKAGLKVLDDAAFQPKIPVEIEHHQVFDPQVREAIKAIADHLGVRVANPVKIKVPGHPNAKGFSAPGLIATQFGSADTLLMHEIGHALDDKYGFTDMFQGNPEAWKQLGDLARLRATQDTDNDRFLAYIQEPAERIANLFHAYWYAPKLAEDIAPAAVKTISSPLMTPSEAPKTAWTAANRAKMPGALISKPPAKSKAPGSASLFLPGSQA